MRPCCDVYVPTEIRVELGFLHSRKFFLLASQPPSTWSCGGQLGLTIGPGGSA